MAVTAGPRLSRRRMLAGGAILGAAFARPVVSGDSADAAVDRSVASGAMTDASLALMIGQPLTKAALSLTYSFKSTIVVVATGTGSSDTASIQAALTAHPGKTIWVTGADTTLTSTLTIDTDRTRLDGDVILKAGFAGGPLVRVLNADYCGVGEGLFFDGNWQTGVAALELRGALLGEFHVTGDRLPIGVNLDCANIAASRNSALNHLWVVIRNGVRGIVFTGKAGQFASNNIVERMEWWGAASATAVGLDFAAYSDNNVVRRAYLHLNAASHIGVVYNSQAPSSDVQVYENHVEAIIECGVPGSIAVKANRTWEALGKWPTYCRLRLSGAHTPAVDIAADSDVVLIGSNLNGVPVVASGASTVAIVASEMRPLIGSPTLGYDWGCPIYTLTEGSDMQLTFAEHIPPEWHQYKVTLYWAPSNGDGGNVEFGYGHLALDAGYSLDDAAVTTAAYAAGTGVNTLVRTVLKSEVPATALMWGSVSRYGTHPGDTATCDARIIAVVLSRTM